MEQTFMYWMPNSVQWPEFFICISSVISRASLVAQRLKCLPGMRETWVQTLGQEDPLEKETATPSSTLAWRIPWREEPGRLQSMGLQRVRRDFTFSLSVSSVTQSCPTSATLWIIARQASLSITNSQSPPKPTIYWVGDAIQPSHPLSSPSPPAPNTSQHQSLFQWVNSSHQVAKILEFQLQHQSFQWTPRTDL